MPTPEIFRCSDCDHGCDELYLRTSTELIFQEKDTIIGGIRAATRTKRLAAYALNEIVRCELSTEQITKNIDDLINGKALIHGREEIST